MSSSIGSDGEVKTWDKQNFIQYETLVDIMQQMLTVAPHPIPPNTYGNLVCVGGVAAAAAEIMDYLEIRVSEKALKELR